MARPNGNRCLMLTDLYQISIALLKHMFKLNNNNESLLKLTALSLSDDRQADIIGALNTTSRYFDHILHINIFLF